VQELVDNVLLGEPARVEDHGLATIVVGTDPDEAVSDPAELVADGEQRHPLEPDVELVEAQPLLPAPDQRIFARSDNDSHYILSSGGSARRRP